MKDGRSSKTEALQVQNVTNESWYHSSPTYICTSDLNWFHALQDMSEVNSLYQLQSNELQIYLTFALIIHRHTATANSLRKYLLLAK